VITSNTYSIVLNDIAKLYKIHNGKLAKIVDLLGFGLRKHYDEFWSLKEINLRIRQGEKVGIIGRNGAGKTTLLRIISGNVQPTTGKITVQGKVHALFVIGTGFHPEFTGRENIRASLAFQGVTGDAAKSCEADIVEFAELEDFIDRPVKTYSAGMYARLAFTVATALEPEILILDEILGTGDAYFNTKAMARMRKLTGGETTVLFVSHDLVSVQKICDRCIWIDRGKIREDGRTLDVIKAYSADVRKRESLRMLAANTGAKPSAQTEGTQLLFRFITTRQTAPVKGFFVHRVALYIREKLFTEIAVGDAMDNAATQDGRLITGPKSNWSESIKKEEKWCREFRDFGGEYIHAAGVFSLPENIDMNEVGFRIGYHDSFEEVIRFERYDAETGEYLTLLTLKSSGDGGWKEASCITSHKTTAPEDGPGNSGNDVYGTGEVILTRLQILGADGKEQHVFTVGGSMIFRLYFRVLEPVRSLAFAIAVYTRDGTTVTQLVERGNSRNPNSIGEETYIDFVIESINIGRGEYLVSVGIFPEIDPAEPVEQSAYCIHDRKYRFKIEQPFGINIDMGMVIQDFKTRYGR